MWRHEPTRARIMAPAPFCTAPDLSQTLQLPGPPPKGPPSLGTPLKGTDARIRYQAQFIPDHAPRANDQGPGGQFEGHFTSRLVRQPSIRGGTVGPIRTWAVIRETLVCIIEALHTQPDPNQEQHMGFCCVQNRHARLPRRPEIMAS